MKKLLSLTLTIVMLSFTVGFSSIPVAEGSSADSQKAVLTSSIQLAKAADTTTQNTEKDYVLNTKSKKFHRPTCKTLPTKNRKDVKDTRENIVKDGYSPCKNCKP